MYLLMFFFCVFAHVPQCSTFVTSFFLLFTNCLFAQKFALVITTICYDKSKNVTQYLSLY